MPIETFVGKAVRDVAGLTGVRDLGTTRSPTTASLARAFFISPAARTYAKARLLAFNGTKEKALIEIYIGRGALAEEVWHVVVERGPDRRWKNESIPLVAISKRRGEGWR